MSDLRDIPPELLARAAARCSLEASVMFDPKRLTLEAILTGPLFYAFPATPPQRAICRAADGGTIGDLLTADEKRYHFGGDVDALPVRPRDFILRCGVRAGKSLIAACSLIHSSLTCQFRWRPDDGRPGGRDGLIGVQPGQLVRAVVVAPKSKQGREVFRWVANIMRDSPLLRPMLSNVLAESLDIVRPDGNAVRVEMVAASASGDGLRSTWLAGVVLDEADFFDAEDAAVNMPDNYRAASTRMLRGGQIWLPSSPWADEGPWFKMFVGAFGSPGRVVAFHSSTRLMNPMITAEEVEAVRRVDPETCAREFEGIPLRSGSKLFFPNDLVKASVVVGRTLYDADGKATGLPQAGGHHHAGADLGFRKNSSALAIARAEGNKVVVAFTEELRPEPGEPLSPSVVCKGFGRVAQRYGCSSIRGDSWYSDSAREHLGELDGQPVGYDEWIPTTDNQTAAFTVLRSMMSEGRLELPDDPRLLSMIGGVKSRPVAGGKIQVVLPKQGAAHADLLMAVVLAVEQCVEGPAIGPWIDYDTAIDWRGD